MKETIKEEEKNGFKKLGLLFTIMLLAEIILPIPVVYYFGFVGMAIVIIWAIATFYVACLVEKQKKKYDIQSYKEIVAFYEGSQLDELSKAREAGKAPYQKWILAFSTGVVTFLIAIVFIYVLI